MSSEDDRKTVVRVTLDHNGLIDLEENGSAAPALRTLVSLHAGGACHLQVVGIGAAELKRDHTYAQTFFEFQHKLAAVGLAEVEILKPVAYLGLTFLDWCVLGGEPTEILERRIHTILFPNVHFEYSAYCAARGLEPESAWGKKPSQKWRNAKCDVLAMWCHIWFRGDIFVTSDRNFHKATKKPQLITLGAGSIVYPDEAVQTLRPSGAADWLEVP